MRKEKFPNIRKFELDIRGNSPFQVLLRINDIAYNFDLPINFNISATLNVSDLSLFDVDVNSRMNPFKGGLDDMSLYQETIDLLNRSVTQAMAKRIAEEAKGKVALFERSFHRLAWYKFEDEEDIQESSKTLLVFTVQ